MFDWLLNLVRKDRKLDFENRVFNKRILQGFRNAFDSMCNSPDQKIEPSYGDYFHYHYIDEDDMPLHKKHFIAYVEEILYQLHKNPAVVLKSPGVWIWLQDLPENLLDACDGDLRHAGARLTLALQKFTGR